MQVLFAIVQLAFNHHIILELWRKKKILLPKDATTHNIRRYRHITLIESDMQWLITFVWAKELNKKCLDEQTLQAKSIYEEKYDGTGESNTENTPH